MLLSEKIKLMKEQQAQFQNTEILQKVIIPEKITRTQIKKAEPEKKITLQEQKISKKKIESLIESLDRPKKQKEPFDIKSFLIEMATESEFERLIYKALFGKVARGSNEEIERKLEIGLKKFRDYSNNNYN